jgi:hypothetical protein
VEYVDVLECMANLEKPPLDREAIKKIQRQLLNLASDKAILKGKLSEIERIFRGCGDMSKWNEELLAKINAQFVKRYLDDTGQPHDHLFFPNNPENLNTFTQYYQDIDHLLTMHPDLAPKYAREYFSYYAIWEMQGYAFPMPLGTARIVKTLDKLAARYSCGFCEMSVPLVSEPLDLPPLLCG